jgi:hypothetical protein
MVGWKKSYIVVGYIGSLGVVLITQDVISGTDQPWEKYDTNNYGDSVKSIINRKLLGTKSSSVLFYLVRNQGGMDCEATPFFTIHYQ